MPVSPIDIALSEVTMRVFKWGNDHAVQIPKELVGALDLKAGDEIDVRITRTHSVETAGSGVASTMTREQALERIRALKVQLPAGWKFDREEANRR